MATRIERISARDSDAIGHCLDFKLTFEAASMSGRPERQPDDTMQYVVRSYNKPIAWLDGGTWYIATQKHSKTTTAHQSAVKRALIDHCAVPTPVHDYHTWRKQAVPA
jgi:hypothetical protein